MPVMQTNYWMGNSMPEIELDLRPKLKSFAQSMEGVLRKNDWKGLWENCSMEYLAKQLIEEVFELLEDLQSGEHSNGEAVDVANVAMMIGDNMGRPYIPIEYYIDQMPQIHTKQDKFLQGWRVKEE